MNRTWKRMLKQALSILVAIGVLLTTVTACLPEKVYASDTESSEQSVTEETIAG